MTNEKINLGKSLELAKVFLQEIEDMNEQALELVEDCLRDYTSDERLQELHDLLLSTKGTI